MRLFCFSSHFSGIAEKRLVWDTPEALPAPKTQPPEEKPKDSLTKEENDRVKAMYDTLKTVTPSEAEKKFMALYEKYAELKEKTKNTTAKKEKDQENRVTILRKIAEAGNGEAITDAVTNPPVPNPDEVPSDVERVETRSLELTEWEEKIAEKVSNRIATGGSDKTYTAPGGSPVYIDRLQVVLKEAGVYDTFVEKYEHYQKMKGQVLNEDEKTALADDVEYIKMAVKDHGQDGYLQYAFKNLNPPKHEPTFAKKPATTPEPTPATTAPKAEPAPAPKATPEPKAPTTETASTTPSKEAVLYALGKVEKKDPDGTRYFDKLGYFVQYEAAQRDTKNVTLLYETINTKSPTIVREFDTAMKTGEITSDTDSFERIFTVKFTDSSDPIKSGTVKIDLLIPEAKKYLEDKPENKRYRDDVFSIPGIKFIIEKPAVTDKPEAPKPGPQPKGPDAPAPAPVVPPVDAPKPPVQPAPEKPAPTVPAAPQQPSAPAPTEKAPESGLDKIRQKLKTDKDGKKYFEKYEDVHTYLQEILNVPQSERVEALKSFKQKATRVSAQIDQAQAKDDDIINIPLTIRSADGKQVVTIIMSVPEAKKNIKIDKYRQDPTLIPGVKFIVPDEK